ncbi:MAG TPA: 5'/3'-nucleotidase SurE [Anaerolineae bacterium]|nr:5'/3'-nucleotidase SurE [Anaerolineae bacterium]
MAREILSRRPYILLTNDDGVGSPGLYAIKRTLDELSDVAVVVPDHNWSACGHSKTMHKPLRVRLAKLADGSEAITTNGSPSDCVALVLLGLLKDRRPGRPHKPDLVVSGINPGANVGQDLTYSGTVAAAMEAVIGGVSAIAVSLDAYEATDYAFAAGFAAYLAYQVLEAQPSQPLLLNVNVPALPEQEIRGVRITRSGRRLYRDALVERTDPRGGVYYWIGGDPPVGVPEDGTDIGALAQGYVSVTPVLLDLTDYVRLTMLSDWRLDLPRGLGE